MLLLLLLSVCVYLTAAAARAEVGREVQLSCGEHTDYGLLTLVNQDPGITALQVGQINCKPATSLGIVLIETIG